MTYQDTLTWMFSRLPMYQRQGTSAYKKDLGNIQKFSTYLNHPETKFKSIHVAGTNGKGSTSHILASVLQEAGYKVGLYTSPHLRDFRERIKINGNQVSKQFVLGFIKRTKSFLEKENLSFFELTVGMAFDYFSKKDVDIVVVETGLGGRLDSTNIITPEVSVITNIGLDHTNLLGNSHKDIAKEKAGIIKENVPVIIGEKHLETTPVFLDETKSKQAEIFFAEDFDFPEYSCDLKGNYQEKNIQTALTTIEILKQRDYIIDKKITQQGLLNVIKNTGLKGRWQIMQQQPKIVCDTVHNVEGLNYVVQQIYSEDYKKLHIVFGVVNDKELQNTLSILPHKATYYFCKPNVPRGLEAKILKEKAREFNLFGDTYDSVEDAFIMAKNSAEKEDFIFVGGSTFVVAEII